MPSRVRLTRRQPNNRKYAQSAYVAPQGGGGGGGTGSLDWFSDWRNGTGTGSTAVLDGSGSNAKWSSNDGNTVLNQVVAATGLGFPGGMTNVLRFDYTAAQSEYNQLHTNNTKIVAPAVGKYCYYRMYWRVVGNNGVQLGAAHPWHGGEGPIYYAWHNSGTLASGNYSWNIRFTQSIDLGLPFADGVFYMLGNDAPHTATSHTYMHQWCIQRTSTTVGRFRVRTSDIDGSNELTEADYSQDGRTLLNVNPSVTIADECFTNLVLGNNDINNNEVATVYVGGIAIRYSDSSTDWIGQYPIAGVES